MLPIHRYLNIKYDLSGLFFLSLNVNLKTIIIKIMINILFLMFFMNLFS